MRFFRLQTRCVQAPPPRFLRATASCGAADARAAPGRGTLPGSASPKGRQPAVGLGYVGLEVLEDPTRSQPLADMLRER